MTTARAPRLPVRPTTLALATEASQLFSHGRFPSVTDLTCNVLGAWLGARWSWVRARQRMQDPAGAQVRGGSVPASR